DAEGQYKFLVHRGVVRDDSVKLETEYKGRVTPLSHVEMIRAPEGGMVLYHAAPGDEVKAGAALVTVVTRPGEPEGDITLTAPQDGRDRKSTRLNSSHVKISYAVFCLKKKTNKEGA